MKTGDITECGQKRTEIVNTTNLSSNSDMLKCWQQITVSSRQRVAKHEIRTIVSEVVLQLFEDPHQLHLICTSHFQELAKFL